MVAYAIDALAWCKANLGKPYLAGGCRCEIPCDRQDCSGWCVAATRAAGLWIPCINSSGFAIWGREAGTIISFDEAIHTPFALLIRGDDGGEDGDGPKGHIMPCVGDGQHTYEEMGTRYGACIGSVFNRRVARCINVPGLMQGPKPSPKPTPQPPKEENVQTYKDLKDPAENNARAVRVTDEGVIVLFGNAVLWSKEKNGAKVTPEETPFGQIVRPDFVKGATYLGSDHWGPNNGFVTMALRPDGTVAMRHFSFEPIN